MTYSTIAVNTVNCLCSRLHTGHAAALAKESDILKHEPLSLWNIYFKNGMIMTSIIFVQIPSYSDQDMRTYTSVHKQDAQVESKEDRSPTLNVLQNLACVCQEQEFMCCRVRPHGDVRKEHSMQEAAWEKTCNVSPEETTSQLGLNLDKDSV